MGSAHATQLGKLLVRRPGRIPGPQLLIGQPEPDRLPAAGQLCPVTAPMVTHRIDVEMQLGRQPGQRRLTRLIPASQHPPRQSRNLPPVLRPSRRTRHPGITRLQSRHRNTGAGRDLCPAEANLVTQPNNRPIQLTPTSQLHRRPHNPSLINRTPDRRRRHPMPISNRPDRIARQIFLDHLRCCLRRTTPPHPQQSSSDVTNQPKQ